jgi:hypothetical protein
MEGEWSKEAKGEAESVQEQAEIAKEKAEVETRVGPGLREKVRRLIAT